MNDAMSTLRQIRKQFETLESVKQGLKKIPNRSHPLTIQGMLGPSKAMFLASYIRSKTFSKTSFAITVTQREAEQLYQDIQAFAGMDAPLLYFPDWEIRAYEPVSPYPDQVHQRILVLHNLLSGQPFLVILPLKALLRYIIPPDVFQREYILFETGDTHEFEDIIRNLVELGYERETIVREPGSFAVKGGILDVFPSSLENPVRIEFFGDEIESIRSFDAFSQKSIAEIKLVEVLPQREMILLEDYILKAVDTVEREFDASIFKNKEEVIQALLERSYFQGIELYQPFFYDPATILEYTPDGFELFLDEPKQLNHQNQTIAYETQAIFNESHHTIRIRPQPNQIFATLPDLIAPYPYPIYLNGLEWIEPTDEVISLSMHSPSVYRSDYETLKSDLQEALDTNHIVIILAGFEGQALRLQAILEELNPELAFELIGNPEQTLNQKTPQKKSKSRSVQLKRGTLYMDVGDISHGIQFEGVLLILDREIFGRSKSFLKKMRKVQSTPIESFVDLKEGDYVVHIHHGIGQYVGIERMEALDTEKDYILLQYADEKLYVPIEQLNHVQKYIGGEVKRTKLDKLGGKSWEQRKARAAERAAKLAKELIALSAARMQHPGTTFGPDTPWQLMFEGNFEYDETPDQLQAIEDVKQDMERSVPMDRLVCGDVGYGKTEVAIRAAFKAVMDGKQVSVLVPTTVLSEQHYFTFKERFGEFPITVEMLSRFRSTKEQKRIIQRLEIGEVDVVIGTHRLLSKDIAFKNLGLVVIDEEQRFGVRHKEQLKKLRTQVDVITMSATPIPRTLNMALSQIRDMSIITTPPENRLPIETFTMEFNEDIIKKAITAEVERGGQCYFVYNRVEGIISFTAFLMKLLPKIRFRYAHGQMDEHELETVIREFIEKKFDVLICTTIIESGMDIPNVNTILIDRADTFGLSQLYQLRGRVGRSKRQAYCYLFYPIDRALTETAQKRLAVINEYTDLGGGFKIAMRDMEIRGAGNVLGPEQSGDIVNIGYELYYKILADAITELKTGEIPIEIDTLVDLNCDSYIPDDYIEDTRQKIEMYKKFAACNTTNDLAAVNQEFKDRFGDLPKPVENLFTMGVLKVLGKQMNITSVVEKDSHVEVVFNEHSKINTHRVPTLISMMQGTLSINPKRQEMLMIRTEGIALSEKVDFIKKILVDLKRDNSE